MKTYFAVCDCGGPISKEIIADSMEDAVAQFEAANTRQWIDDSCMDAEDEFDFCGDGMDEGAFADALESNGCVMVGDLSEVVNGHTMAVSHISGGWCLWESRGETQAYTWAKNAQGFEGTFDDWRAMAQADRDEYETGAQGIGTV